MTETAVDTERHELTELSEGLLERFCTVDHLKERLDSGTAHSVGLWRQLAESGLVSAVIPDEFGGLGLTPSHLSGVLYSFGRYAVPEPFLETSVIAVSLLRAARWPDAPSWLERIAAGDAIVAVRFDGARQVTFARDADLLLDVTADGSVRAFAADELELTELRSLDDLQPVAAVTLRGAGVDIGIASDDVEHVRVLAMAGAACLLAGATRRLLELTVDYVSIRTQFGRPVGSFQAVKHKVADVAVMADMAGAAALSALDGIDDPGAYTRAAAAKAYAGDAAQLANLHALQLHGGIGFTWEYHLHIWLKRVMSLSAAYGTTRSLRRALAARLIGQVVDGGQR